MLNDFHMFYFLLPFKVLFISTVNCRKKKKTNWKISPRQNHDARCNNWIWHLEPGHKVIEKKKLEPACHVHYDRCNNSLKVPLRNSSSLSLLLVFCRKCQEVLLLLFFLIANFFFSKKTHSGNVCYEGYAFPTFFVQKQLCLPYFFCLGKLDFLQASETAKKKYIYIQLDQ